MGTRCGFENIDCGYSLEPQRVPTIYVFEQNEKNNEYPCLKIFNFSVISFSVYLNRHVFVMQSGDAEIARKFMISKINDSRFSSPEPQAQKISL